MVKAARSYEVSFISALWMIFPESFMHTTVSSHSTIELVNESELEKGVNKKHRLVCHLVVGCKCLLQRVQVHFEGEVLGQHLQNQI